MSSGARVLLVAPASSTEVVILVQYHDQYVTGFVSIDEIHTATEWFWGHYFYNGNRLADAIEDFLARSTDNPDGIAAAVVAIANLTAREEHVA
jgi:hypothetical protein